MKTAALKHYDDNMEKFVEETSFQDQSELEARHNQCKDEAMTNFETCKEGPQDVFEKTKKELEEEIKIHFNKIKNQNEKNQKIELDRLQRQVISRYKKKFEEATNGEYLRNENLTKVLKDCDSEAITAFKEETKMFLPELVREQRKELDAERNEEKKGFKKQNQDRKLAAIAKCHKKRIDAVEDYKTKIDNCVGATPCQDQSELEARHKRYKDEAMKEFQSFKEVPQDKFKEQKKELEDKITDLFEKAKLQNKNKVERKIDAIIADAHAYFFAKFNKFYDGRISIILFGEIALNVLHALLAILVAKLKGETTISSLEFYKEYASKLENLEDKHEALLKEKQDKVEGQIQGPQNQAAAKERIEAELFDIGRKMFCKAYLTAYLKFGLIPGGLWGGATAGAGVGSLFGPIGTVVGGVTGGIAGYLAGKKGAEKMVEVCLDWVENK